MAFMINRNLIFIHSFQFMNQSLSNLANDLPKDGFYHTKKMSLALTTLINKKKGVHPYDYMDGFDKFDKKGLPSIEKNYSKLTC